MKADDKEEPLLLIIKLPIFIAFFVMFIFYQIIIGWRDKVERYLEKRRR